MTDSALEGPEFAADFEAAGKGDRSAALRVCLAAKPALKRHQSASPDDPRLALALVEVRAAARSLRFLDVLGAPEDDAEAGVLAAKAAMVAFSALTRLTEAHEPQWSELAMTARAHVFEFLGQAAEAQAAFGPDWRREIARPYGTALEV